MHDQTSVGGSLFMTAAELATRWGVTRGSLANMRSEGRGPAYLNFGGRSVRYRREDILAYEQSVLVARP